MRYISRYRIPVEFISYIEYGDATGLSDEDEELIKTFLEREFPHGYVADYVGIDEPYFTYYPDVIHLGAEVIDVDFYEP
ncbi:MAG: hypothetical protein K5854_01695 [Prevotella sp.]|nr:hypothetical protein [Prevotella sp.]